MALSAQYPSGSPGIVFPIAGHPFCAQIEEQIQNLPDGSVAVQTISGTVCRDQAGRTRTEWMPVSGKSSAGATVVDPVGGFIIALEPVSRTAVRLTVPASRPDRFGFSLPGIADRLPQGKWKTATESIEKRRIEGIDFEGTRMTNLSEDEPSLSIVYEWWASKALGLVGLAIASGPNGKHTLRIQHIDWRIPDPELFAVPSDYIVREVSVLGPERD